MKGIYKKLLNKGSWFSSHSEDKRDVKNTRTKLENKMKKVFKEEILCLECENYVPCKDKQCSNFMCNIDKRCFHGEINREDCPLDIHK